MEKNITNSKIFALNPSVVSVSNFYLKPNAAFENMDINRNLSTHSIPAYLIPIPNKRDYRDVGDESIIF